MSSNEEKKNGKQKKTTTNKKKISVHWAITLQGLQEKRAENESWVVGRGAGPLGMLWKLNENAWCAWGPRVRPARGWRFELAKLAVSTRDGVVGMLCHFSALLCSALLCLCFAFVLLTILYICISC